jgi:hypothetical protein
MTRKPHPSARTTPRLRREIQQSGESNRALASRLGLNEKTIAKWHGRRSTSDAPMGPKHAVSSGLDAADEALIVIFRKRTRLPIDDCLPRLKSMIPLLSRSALCRCLKRYRVSRIPKGEREKPMKMKAPQESGRFAIEIHALGGEMDGSYLFTAIVGLTKLVFAKTAGAASADAAADFLAELIQYAAVGISCVETNDHKSFTDSQNTSWDLIEPPFKHPFRKACCENEIVHIVAKSKNPAPKMVSKGW